MPLLRVFILCLGLVGFASASTANEQTPFDTWLTDLRTEALGEGISKATLDAALHELSPIPRVIELDRKQPEFTLSFAQYLKRVVPARRVTMGQQRLAKHSQLLQAVGKKYGVQPRFVVALWGVETDFGRITGGFSVIQALATLAYDGRRSRYFRGELINALKILDEGHIGIADMKGSWAGAMGQSQFMPSSFRRFAVDENGDGRRDIWTTQADVFASAANYLARSGWKDDQTWGREISLPQTFDHALFGLETRKPLSEWQALGVRKLGGGDLPGRELQASLVRPGKDAGPIYLVYNNYRSLLKWNRSHYFATAVGLLSDRIAQLP